MSERTGSIDQFLVSMDNVKKRIETMEKTIDAIERYHRQALSATSIEEATRLSRLIDELVTRNNDEAQKIRQILKAVTAETEALKQGGKVSPSDLRLRATQQSRSAKKFMATMNRFQQMQTTYQTKYKQQLERQYLLVKPTATREELDRLTEGNDGSSRLLNQQIFAMANRAQAQKTLAEMKERQHDIQSIEKSLRELHQMFVDMAMIVEQQGETLDKIQDYVASTVEYTEVAAGEMRGAVSRQKSLQKKKWIMVIICIIILIVVGVILSVSLTTGGGK